MNNIVETMMRYCSETLNALTLKYLTVEEEAGQKMRPLLLRLQKFGLIDCKCSDSFLNMLPSCLPKLREFELKTETNNNWGLIQAYPKLEAFSIGSLSKKQFEEFLKKNQQLKSIELNQSCKGDVYFNIIIKHLPTIESLNIFVPARRSANWNNADVHNLKSLKKLVIKGGSFYFCDTLHRMAAEKNSA